MDNYKVVQQGEMFHMQSVRSAVATMFLSAVREQDLIGGTAMPNAYDEI